MWVEECRKTKTDAPPSPIQLAYTNIDVTKAAAAHEKEQHKNQAKAQARREEDKRKREEEKRRKAEQAGGNPRERSVGKFEKFKKSHQTVTYVAGELLI
jgi:hypothetical protein